MAKRKSKRTPARKKPPPLPRGTGTLPVSAEQKREAARRADEFLDKYEKQLKSGRRVAPGEPPRLSPFSLSATTPAERYKRALAELRKLRHGFDRKDGYKAAASLTDAQKRRIREAFNSTRRLLAVPHTIAGPEIMPKGKRGDFDKVMRSYGQRGGSKTWKKAILPAPAQTRKGEPLGLGVRQRADGKYALMQRGVQSVRVKLNERVFLAPSPFEGVLDSITEHAPDATRFRLLMRKGVTGWESYDARGLANKIHFMLESDQYNDPEDWLVGYVAYVETGSAKSRRYKAAQHVAMENERRDKVREAKGYWSKVMQSITNREKGRRQAARRLGAAPEEIDDIIVNYRDQDMREARVTARERGILLQSELWENED